MTEAKTIAAISTPYGRGGIAVIRLSGADAIMIGAKIFRPGSDQSTADFAAAPSNHMMWGRIYLGEEQIDDGMAVIFRAPHSYTGEDTVEISCHGGILITQKVLEAALLAGAVSAGPGEFTKRAFLNGKLGLSQAEAVIDLIDAESMEKIRMAGAGARGALKRKTDEIYEQLKAAIASTYAYIDYPDEDLTELSPAALTAEVTSVRDKLSRLSSSYATGKAVNEGIRTAIVGKPNTGKSSLLNCLLGEERAIVTDIAGTTRDVLQENMTLGRVMLRLSDTAGIHGTEDAVERLGVERSLSAIADADLVLAVFDTAKPFDKDDLALAARLSHCSCPVIAIENKTDLPRASNVVALCVPFSAVISVSAKNGEGVEKLTEVVERLFISGDIDYKTDGVIANARQYAAVSLALEHTMRALTALNEGHTQDIACMDLELALSALGEIDGRVVTGEIVDSIFHNFCVGK